MPKTANPRVRVIKKNVPVEIEKVVKVPVEKIVEKRVEVPVEKIVCTVCPSYQSLQEGLLTHKIINVFLVLCVATLLFLRLF